MPFRLIGAGTSFLDFCGDSRRSLAQRSQAAERLPRKRTKAFERDTPPGSRERDLDRTSAGHRLDPRFSDEILLKVPPGENPARLHERDHDQAITAWTAQQAGRTRADDAPAGPFGHPAPVGTDGRVPGPPVRQMVWLGEQCPQVVRRRVDVPGCR